ncbi:M28 family peptidase [Ulvibacter antarcticus]|uniref:Vacuolar membrane protease n=1 Tax=Ulvibacter antarcticus TaxID=442714 RepID=A0A3L9ZGL5_9FLAO|nr:M28 family peptidase [Ulvibacter antarcticus]RMA65872.1 peptidase M28-like protein [Ulvibacter antarcticus]
MKRSFPLLSFLLIIGLIYYSFYSLMPQKGSPSSVSETEFSTQRALIPLKEISKAPHYHGSEEQKNVRNYLLKELQSLGLETETQEGFVLNPEFGTLDKPINIVARLKGVNSSKSLLLHTHYDSALVPSFGASDAGSGIVTILESLRAFKATGKQPKNDIIVLFSDSEEIDLEGARLFQANHPWAKNIGIALNFEARGSGGPSVMILESNGGNQNLIKAFIEANPEYPVASSLMYSVYKMLPNKTDSTVLREGGDIDCFFFAFMDDHFDYHTANDTVENLDINSLAHQGSYLLPLLTYFADADLSNLKSDVDDVYVNMPFVKMIHYPFAWILPMIIISCVILIVLIFFGIRKKKLNARDILKGFIPFLLSLIICGILGFYGWKLLLAIYPQYEEVQQGFKYNGHAYIAAFVFLSLAILFYLYDRFSKRENVVSIFIAPIIFWIIINVVVFLFLKGAGYFIIPVFFGLLSLWLLVRQQKANLLLMALLAAPAIFLYAPLIQLFPVALGSDHVVISCVFTVLLFGLLIPVLGFYNNKSIFSIGSFVLAIIFLISAHFKSDFSEKRQKPNSLIYYENADSGNAYWLTYDKILDDWTKGYLGKSPEAASKYVNYSSGSKYNKGYTFASEAPQKEISDFETVLQKDTIENGSRNVTFTIFPKRHINQLSLYADTTITFQSLAFNGQEMPKNSSGNVERTRASLLRYIVANNDSLEVSYTTKQDIEVPFTVLEYSFDLMSNNQFTINKRPKYTMPKPFIITDAIVVKKTISINTMQKRTLDSITPQINE